ncbi:hypothetical protein D3C85_1297000 [compost metagenome]
MSGAEPLGVLRHVTGVDGQQRLFPGVGIGVAAAAGLVQVRRCAAPLATPGGDAAIGIAGHFRAQGSQVLAQARGLFGADLGLRRGAEQAGNEQDGQPRIAVVFVHVEDFRG